MQEALRNLLWRHSTTSRSFYGLAMFFSMSILKTFTLGIMGLDWGVITSAVPTYFVHASE